MPPNQEDRKRKNLILDLDLEVREKRKSIKNKSTQEDRDKTLIAKKDTEKSTDIVQDQKITNKKTKNIKKEGIDIDHQVDNDKSFIIF